ncbi:isocitrate dehydrogenase [NADP] [Olea europaea subsp. europaea]|uniref:Isocitrate dehydrogenase [NADP] n=1 Tax=Olea europaea subsp. europaea TaxID=158383 RepID=A0A8S0T5N7_OLEEU|nr:isocitrate dehydrogenase [NADP] [Olea europaea subsp. europaea]
MLRAKLDNDVKLFLILEAAYIGAVESGKITKDLALIIHGSKLGQDKYLITEEFTDTMAEELKDELSC